jgi:hypothetical protein
MQLVKGGTSWATFNEGLAKWRERRNIVISDIEVNQK